MTPAFAPTSRVTPPFPKMSRQVCRLGFSKFFHDFSSREVAYYVGLAVKATSINKHVAVLMQNIWMSYDVIMSRFFLPAVVTIVAVQLLYLVAFPRASIAFQVSLEMICLGQRTLCRIHFSVPAVQDAPKKKTKKPMRLGLELHRF